MSDERVSLIVVSKAKEFIKSQGCIVSADAITELNNKVYELLTVAVKRTKDNKRTTLRPHDF